MSHPICAKRSHLTGKGLTPMRLRSSALVLTLFTAFSLEAQLEKFKDWDKSPEYVYYATDDEKKAWNKITSDADADKFIQLFWAKRDPDLKTPVNEFKQRFDALVAKADERFALGKKRGALTERGKALIIIGPPKSISERVESSGNVNPGDSVFSQTGGAGGTAVIYQFKYEKPQQPEWAEGKTFDLGFRVDVGLGTESVLNASELKRFEKKAAQMSIKNPDLKEPPIYKTREQVEKEIREAQEKAAEAARGPALTPAVRENLEALFTKEPAGLMAIFPLAYRDGALRMMVQMHFPASALPVQEGSKIAILVKDKEGKDAARVEEAVTFMKIKSDLMVDRVIPVVPGDYDVAIAILDPAGKPVATARRKKSVAALPTEFAISELFLAYADVPVEGSKPEDPFIFSQRKFLSRGDAKLEKTDGLSYVVRVYNPGVDPITKKTGLKREIKIKSKGQMPQTVPLPPDEPSVVLDSGDPTTTIVLDMAGAIVDNNLGDYFRSGETEFRIKIIDTILNKTLEATATFNIAGPPPGQAPAAPKKK